MKKILLAGASTYGVKNMGDDAMLYNLTTHLHKNSDCEITFLARHPNNLYDELYKIKSIKNYEFNSNAESYGKWFYGFNPEDSKDHLIEIKNAISECDLVIIGGNSFMEVSPNQFMRGVATYASLLVTLAIFFNKPYVLYGVAGHEIKGDLTKEIARYLGNNSRLVTVREDFYKQVLQNCGVKPEKVIVCGDPAFGVDPNFDNKLSDEIFKREKIVLMKNNLIGIGFRHMYWVWNEEQYNNYSAKMAELCDFMIEQFDAEILFIPNCTYSMGAKYEDDRIVAEHTLSKMRHRNSAYLVREEMNLLETVSLYNRTDMIVSNRRHSNIFGAVHYKPMFALSSGHPWQFKPFMSDLGLDDYYADLVDDDLSVLIDRVQVVWNNKEKIREQLKKTVPGFKDSANNQAKLFLQVIDEFKG